MSIKNLINRRLFGFDFFISYGRRDGLPYATALEAALKSRGFRCFLDHKDMPPGQSLSATTRQGLSASRVLLLVATDGAMASPHVEAEVRTFQPRGRPIVAINLAGTFERTSTETGVRALLGDNIWFSEPDSAIPTIPSEPALASLVRSFTFTKESVKRQRRLLATACTLLVLVIAALVEWYLANARARVALSRQLAAEAQTYLAEQPDLAALLSIEARRVQDTVEARSALLAAVNERPRLTKTLPRMPEYPLCAAMNRAGTLLAVGGASGTIGLWRLPGAEPIGDLFGEEGDSVWKIRFDPTGTRLVSATDKAIRVWKVDVSPPVSYTLTNSQKNMLGIDLSPDGKVLVAGGDEGHLYVWDMSHSEAVFRTALQTHGKIWTITFSPSGGLFAVGTRGGSILLYDAASLRPRGSLREKPHGEISSLSFRPDGEVLASGYKDGTVLLWSIPQRKVVGAIKHKERVDEVTFSPDGNLIASGGTGEVLSLWSVSEQRELEGLALTDFDSVNALIFTPDAQYLIAVQEGYGLIWDAAGTHSLVRVLHGHTDKIWGLAATPHGDLVASGGKDATALMWHAEDGRRIDPPMKFGRATVRSMAFSPDERLLAVGYGTGAVVLWRVSDHQPAGKPLRAQTEPVISLSFSPDGHYLASASSDGSVALFDLRSSTLVKRYWNNDGMDEVDISPDGKLLVSCSDDNKILWWNLETKTQLGAIDAGNESTNHIHFSPDSKFLAWFNGTRIVLWKIGTPPQQRVYLQGHVGDINSLTFSPDGGIIASGTMDHEVVLWDVKSRQRFLRPLKGHDDIVWKVAFARNGRVLASSSNDKTVRLWDVDVNHWTAHACSIANRNLSSDEWSQYLPGEARRPTCPEIQR
jgi:WD40 repeat protein